MSDYIIKIETLKENIVYESEEELYGEDSLNRHIYEKIINASMMIYHNALRVIRGDTGLVEPYISFEKSKDILEEIYEIVVKNSMVMEKDKDIEDVLNEYMLNTKDIYRENPTNEEEYIKINKILSV